MSLFNNESELIFTPNNFNYPTNDSITPVALINSHIGKLYDLKENEEYYVDFKLDKNTTKIKRLFIEPFDVNDYEILVSVIKLI